jgi:hypothetical protein
MLEPSRDNEEPPHDPNISSSVCRNRRGGGDIVASVCAVSRPRAARTGLVALSADAAAIDPSYGCGATTLRRHALRGHRSPIENGGTKASW